MEAIVLKSYDVGEADRFLVLLTRERGRIAARARGVRKLKSRMGGHLLPLRDLSVTIVEGSAGYLVTAAKLNSEDGALSLDCFVQAQQACELLLTLLHDEEEVGDVFEITRSFLCHVQREASAPLLTFMVRVLDNLGHLPETSSRHYTHFSDTERSFIANAQKGAWVRDETLSRESRQKIDRTLCGFATDHTQQELRTQKMLHHFA